MIGLFIASIQHTTVFQIVSVSFMFLSFTLADLLDLPVYRQPSPIQSLNL